MLTTKRLLLGLLVLGIVGMHGLVTSSGTTAAHHGWTAASAALSASFATTTTASTATATTKAATTATMTTADHEHAPTSADRSAAASDTASATSATRSQDGDESTTALALCMALLLAFGAAAFGGRRTTWVAQVRASVRTTALPLPPVLRDSTPVPRFTVMRC
jgi:hypothetical protein